ncbi:MAG: polysaccharide deacetylase family protein [Verrucomicrobiae bacterium]|nr:polysaccharide deacetylase family protein [Verrucomicrobiae bacterium]
MPRLPGTAEAPVPSFSHGPSGQKQVALTFDDGPHPTITPLVLDVLRARGVKATFFVVGIRVKAYPWVLRQVVAEGHEIGNHSYSHRPLVSMSDEAIRHEVGETQTAIRNAIGYETSLFRPPYGVFHANANAIFREHKLNVIRWSVDPRDWRLRDATLIANHVTLQSKNGAIILCHDIHRTTLQALPTILDTLISEGYAFKTVSELCGLPPLRVITASHAPPAPAPEAKN